MKFQLILVACLASLAMAQPPKPKDLACDLCIDIIQDIDEALKNDVPNIIEAVDQICDQIGDLFPGGAIACKLLVQTQLPSIIDDLINNQLKPETICGQLGACPSGTTAAPSKVSIVSKVNVFSDLELRNEIKFFLVCIFEI